MKGTITVITTKNLIEGLTILEKYRDNEGRYNTSAEHDILYAFSTDEPVGEDDVKRLVEMGWFQPDAPRDENGDFGSVHYNPSEGWAAYV